MMIQEDDYCKTFTKGKGRDLGAAVFFHKLTQLSELKLVALKNMYFMSVTELTSQFEMSELKLVANANMPSILVTELTSQFEMSELKLDAPLNMRYMSVTSFTHHVPISPY